MKILFTSHHFESDEIFLKSILKMTPNSAGKWKNIEATLNPKEADYYFVMDGERQMLPDMDKKAIYFGEHPNTPYSPGHKLFSNKKALLKLPLRDFLNPHEWWINFSYDDLTNMKTCSKMQKLSCIATYQSHHPMYAQRQVFLRELVKKYPELPIDIYGRPIEKYNIDTILKPYYKGCLGNNNYDATKGEHIIGKDDVLMRSQFTLEFDVGETKNYFSERWADSILMWCTPIYFGSTNAEDFYPHKDKAYFLFNQHNLDEVNRIPEIIKQTPKEYYNEKAELRYLILNKYQLWSYCHHIVNNINSYLTNPIKTHQKWIKGEIND